jgi:hypothetical protein
MRGGSGAVGSFFFLLPPAVAGGVGSMGVVGVRMESSWGGLPVGEGMGEGPSQVDVNTTLGLLTPYWVV